MKNDMTNKFFQTPMDAVKQSGARRIQNSISRKATAPNIHLMPQANIFNLKGFQCGYSIVDAATSLWQRENTLVQRGDAASVARLQARLRNGNLMMTPSQKEIKDYLVCLRRDGLDGQIDWCGLAAEFRSFQDMQPEELTASLDYVASRYVSVLDKLKRNYTGDELAEQEAKLKDIWATGMTGMVDGYAGFLQNSLGISELGAHAVRISLDALIEQRVCEYCGMVEQANTAAAQAGPDSSWLCNHDAYMATRLREAAVPSGTCSIPVQGTYSARDLAIAGRIAQAYQFEIEGAYAGSRNEAQLALNLAFADMKAETLILRNLVSGRMAALLHSSRPQGHFAALNAVGVYLDYGKDMSPPDPPEGPFASVEYTVFQNIYEAVLSAYHQNGGNGAEAIRAGVTCGEAATAQAHAKNPKAVRWGMPMERYWGTFYTVPAPRKQTLSDLQIQRMLAQIGRSPSRSNSPHQNYINDWQRFLVSVDRAQ